jgi:hypothetical protein
MTMPPQGHELFRRVQQAAEGTPYAVEETDRGFDVTLNVVDAQWYGLFNKAGLEKVFIHHVAFPKDGVYTITDDSRSLDWVAGVPQLKASAERQYGRVIEFGAQKVWAFDERGRFGVQADYRFNSEEGRDLITGVADQVGLTLKRGGVEKGALYFGIAVAIGAVIVAVLNLVLWLTGYYG